MYPQSGSDSSSAGGGWQSRLILVVLVLLALASLIFGGWAYKKMSDYKNISDAKINSAANAIVATREQQIQNDFDSKNTKAFQGPVPSGSITFNYPKAWSAYVDTTNSSEPINGYFYPDTVPGIQGKTAYALRIELVTTDYAQLMQQFNSLITQGVVTAKAYIPPKMQGVANVVAGTYLSGQINNQDQTQRGNMLVIKVRDKTLEIYTEANSFSADFNSVVLASLSFLP